MPTVLDPAQIEAFAQRAIPRLRLAEPGTVFSARAARLRDRSAGHALADYLRLMAALCDAQQSALAHLAPGLSAGEHPVELGRIEERLQLARAHGMPLLQASDWPRDPRWRAVLTSLCTALAATAGFPAAVAETCQRLERSSPAVLEEQAHLLLSGESEGIDPQGAPLLMAALQVYWLNLVRSLAPAVLHEHVTRVDAPGVCPVCGTPPAAGIVRADVGYQGYRYLHCALCESQWHLVRITCSHCQSTEGIHYFTVEGGSPAIRAEACDRCRGYRKICYQEQDPHVEPLADDLASIALDLLMSDEGFHRVSGHPLLWQSG